MKTKLIISSILFLSQGSVAGDTFLRKNDATNRILNSNDDENTFMASNATIDQRYLSTFVDHVSGGSNTPLGLCQGDCDHDDECAGSFKCFKRSGTEKIPGCIGASSYPGQDFCYDPSSDGDSDGGDSSSNGGGDGGSSFRIKMYWEKGYYWQEETFDRKWCVECRRECNDGVELAIHECNKERNTRFQFVTTSGSSEVQIKVSGMDLCWSLVGRATIKLRACDSTNDRQKFTAGAGDFNGKRFEISPIWGGCLSQDHHPRDGEVLYKQGCDRPRYDTTSFFNKY